jgi:hypothetical protein
MPKFRAEVRLLISWVFMAPALKRSSACFVSRGGLPDLPFGSSSIRRAHDGPLPIPLNLVPGAILVSATNLEPSERTHVPVLEPAHHRFQVLGHREPASSSVYDFNRIGPDLVCEICLRWGAVLTFEVQGYGLGLKQSSFASIPFCTKDRLI